jgi:hypothetical protein
LKKNRISEFTINEITEKIEKDLVYDKTRLALTKLIKANKVSFITR